MACLGCSCSSGKDSKEGDSKPGGCGSNGGCSTGGCNRRNTYDWISALGIRDVKPFDIVEVSFKNGTHKFFYKNPGYTRASTGDMVCVEAQSGYNVGQVSLSGELVRLQMKKKKVRPDTKFGAVIRIANQRDMEKLDDVRQRERDSLRKARVISRTLKLNMKIGDVEYQGDGRKATFYYTAEGRVDFRELIRMYAKEFKVKIEMRQIGMRQESALIGGLGNCGRELCCSTWLTNFKSVNTAAARYQNLAINQTKLTGMCGRLKCCLNFELDTYLDALEEFPDRADHFETEEGKAILIKTDVFKRMMFYTYARNRGRLFPLHVEQVWSVLDGIKNGKKPKSLAMLEAVAPKDENEEQQYDFAAVNNVLELPIEKRKRRKKRPKRKNTTIRQTAQKEISGGGAKSGNSRSSDRKPRPQSKSRNRPAGPQSKRTGPKPGQKTNPKPPGSDRPAQKPKVDAKKTPTNQNKDKSGTKPPSRRYPDKKK